MADQVHISLQDVIRCELCDTPVPPKHCDVCHIHLCEECEGKHTSDESKEHVIVPFEMRGSTPKCSKHSKEICARYCKTCDTPICASCDSSDEHKRHKTEHISKMSDGRKEPGTNGLQTGTKFLPLEMLLKIIIPCICIFIVYCGVRYFLFYSVVPNGKIHVWLIVGVLEAFMTICLQDFLFFCMKHVCDLDFMITNFLDYLNWLTIRIQKPRKINTTRQFTPLKNKLKLILSFVCINLIDFGVRYFFIFSVVPGQNIDLWLVVAVLNAIVLFFLVDFLFFCLKPVCGLDFIECGYLFEYLKLVITRIKGQRKNDLQTTTNVTLFKMSERCVIACVCIYVIFFLVVCFMGLIAFNYYYLLLELTSDPSNSNLKKKFYLILNCLFIYFFLLLCDFRLMNCA